MVGSGELVVGVCFNSLRTGKPIQRRHYAFNQRFNQRSFNSLRTGKPIQSDCRAWPCQARPSVSIPYERESLSKGETTVVEDDDGSRFQFPTNGKAYPKEYILCMLWQESKCFNSLRTGKPIQREFRMTIEQIEGVFVSIPYERESLSKGNNG